MATVLESLEDPRSSGDWKNGVEGTTFTSRGFICEGEAFHVTPFNNRTVFDFFTPVGKASNIMTSYLFYLGKRSFYEIHKLEDWIEVSPVQGQYYQLTIQQKQQLERQIKDGLASISQAVSDLELLLHDMRKYREFLEYFEKVEAAKGSKAEEKEKAGIEATKAEQTLKAIFIDEVDVHTDLPQTPISLRSIVSRWPTIISDFMKLTDDDTDPSKIAAKLSVSEAEGVVLATKNKLYRSWKVVFKQTITDRYQRIKQMVNARARSVQEYKNMLQPYIHRYRSIREFGETAPTRVELERTDFFRHAGQAVSVENTTTWAWREQTPAEFAKAGRLSETGDTYDIKNWKKLPIAKGFKLMIADRMERDGQDNFLDYMKDKNLRNIAASTTGAEPLDNFVFKHYKKIETHYNVKFEIEDILDQRQKFCSRKYSSFYFMSMEIGTSRSVFRNPDGSEFEDLWIEPFLMYFDTQNVIMLRMLEILGKRKQEENYINSMLGEEDPEGKNALDMIKEEYPHLFGETKEETEKYKKIKKALEKEIEKAEKAATEKKKKAIADQIREAFKKMGLDVAFFKRGPYETHFDDRVTGIWFPDMAASVYVPSVNMLKAYMQVPGFKVPT